MYCANSTKQRIIANNTDIFAFAKQPKFRNLHIQLSSHNLFNKMWSGRKRTREHNTHMVVIPQAACSSSSSANNVEQAESTS